MKPATPETLPQENISETLYRITGYHYSFAVASDRCWDNIDNIEHSNGIGYFQLMPDGQDGGFFNHYCDKRPYNQFFRTREDCALNFLYRWAEWRRSL